MPLSLQTFDKIADATKALQAKGARYLGGGTLAIRDVNEGSIAFNTLVRSTDKSLGAIIVKGGSVSLGASVTMAQVASHKGLQFVAPAARAIGGPAIRNMATVGGNLFTEAPYGDFTVALLALGAEVVIGKRKLTIDAFLASRHKQHGIVTAVRFDKIPTDEFHFVKVTRVKPKGTSVVTIAVRTTTKHDGTISSARIALGCLAGKPMRAKKAEIALIGSRLTEQGITGAIEAITDGISSITDPVASGWYRREVLPVHFRRLLLGKSET